MSEFSAEIDNRLKTLGICPLDLNQALTLVRNLRVAVIEMGLDPKATRIALLFAELVDRHFSQQKLHPTEMTQIHDIARVLFTQASKKWRRKT